MRNLKALVPSLKLCKQIPAGKFGDSYFTWCLVSPAFLEGMGCGSVRNNQWRILNTPFRERRLPGILDQFPAPTLAEILDELSKTYTLIDVIQQVDGEWHVSGWKTPVKLDKNPATAALKLWLEVTKAK